MLIRRTTMILKDLSVITFLLPKLCAALVGDSRTPSFPSSVHIPSLYSHQSLLLSRNEVFKEVQDVGEDTSASSLHHFFKNMEIPPLSYHDSLEELCNEEEEPEEIETMIKLEESLPPIGMIYSLPNQESDTLRAYISENVERGFNRPNSSSTGAPAHFVRKKDGGLRLCVGYHKLNTVTRKDKYPVPPINQLLANFNGSSIFSKIDLHGAYNLLRIKEGDENLTSFRTKYGSYEYLVVPFGLTNSPASFQNLFNDIFYDLLGIYAVVYLDEIMVFSKSTKEHVTHVSTALARLRANNLFAKAPKCLFHVSSVEYLCYIVSSQGLKMDQVKVQQILNWPPSRNPKALQSFLGFANFYLRFIKNYSKEISPLARLLNKDPHFPLNEDALRQFHQFKTSLDLAHLLIKNIFSKNGLLSSIVSDRETGGQTERLNKILEQYLWLYVSYHQEDWNTSLPLAEFSCNNSDHSSTKKSPLFTVYRRDPHFDSVHMPQDTPAGNLSTKIQYVKQDVKRELEVGISRFKRYADKSRAIPPVFNPGDMVCLSTRTSNKLDPPKNCLKDGWVLFKS
ncbi:hypothetical protein O181_024434 [Austropuccinia psidii MF-1]|uniref:Reverse transcriptase domain-containing protein n=1 Tax=Austropuccinia psidii MF-1 TaxID=1389203 RepID=A0A9Q3GZN9_9BASI|nr:hypothetical protein [Austropuccinia psidii MF-1]